MIKSLIRWVEKWWTKREQSLMDSSLGSWDPSRDLYSLDMRWESFGMLLWACRIFKDVPTYDGFFPRERAYTSTAIIPAGLLNHQVTT